MRLVIALIFSILAVAARAADAPHDKLTIGGAQFPSGLNPTLAGQDALLYATGFALRPVTVFGHDGLVACLLCTEVPTLENGLAKHEGKGLAVTIKLKPDLKWGDGAPVTAHDIAFSWKLLSNPAGGFVSVFPWSRATTVEVVDDHTAVLHLDKTYTSYPLWGLVLPEHIEGPIVAAATTPADYINHTVYNRAPTTPGLWNGPYMPAQVLVNQSIDFVPNPYWSGPKPGFQHILLRLVENTAALQANLLSGDVDMTPSEVGLTIDQAITLQKDHGDRFRIIFKPQLTYE